MKYKNLNDEELLKDIDNLSMTQLQVCEKHKIGTSTLNKWLKMKGLQWQVRPDPKKVIFTEELHNYILSEHKKGKSLIALEGELDIAHCIISKHLRKFGIDTSEKKHRDVLKITDDNKELIIKMYKEDRSSGHSIGEKLGVSGFTIYRRLHDWGIEVIDKIIRMDVRANKDKILELYNNNHNITFISEMFKCDYNCIIKCLQEWGIDTKIKRPYVGTYIENKVEKFLVEQNIPYEKQFRICPEDRSKFDFYIKGTNLLIETHGDYWHGNPKKYEELDDIQKFKKNLDRKKRKLAKMYGYKYVWIWGEDIRTNFKKVKTKILKWVSLYKT